MFEFEVGTLPAVTFSRTPAFNDGTNLLDVELGAWFHMEETLISGVFDAFIAWTCKVILE